jgi:radical SAM superfamily enzyme YgiQ (UPF0313 family)
MPFPFQLAYAASILERDGIEVLLVDAIAERSSDETYLKKIEQFKPDLIVHEVSTPSFSADIRMVEMTRKQLGNAVKIALCGPHAPMLDPSFLKSFEMVDIVFSGEYELALRKTAAAMDTGQDFAAIPGMVFRHGSGQVIATGQAEVIKNIDDLPLPARHFLPMEKYFDNPGNIPEPALQMWGSRGCPYSCSYCIWPQLMNGDHYRPRQPARMLDEIEHICTRYNYKSVYFDDDTFNIDKKRMLEFCREKIRRQLDLPWAIMARADLMDREILEAMAESGLKAVKYGIESASQDLIERIGKNLNLDKAIENVELTKSLGIKVHLTFMFGMPGETKESALETVELAKKLNPESVQFSILTPLPGTAIYDELLAKGHLQVSDWERLDGYFSSVVRTDAMSSEELEEMVQYAWRSWVKHKTLQKPSSQEIKWAMKSLPKYLRHPKAAWQQLKRLV